MKTQVRLSLVLSVVAIVAVMCGIGGAYAGSLIVTSKQIKNGTILTQDIHKSGVNSSDLANGTVSSPDIGGGEVEPQDVTMPPPAQTTPPTAQGPVTTAGYTKLTDLGTYTKVQAASTLEVSLSGAVAPGPGTNCVFQLRVNGAEPTNGGGEVFAQTSAVNVSTTAQFIGLPAAPVTVELWAKASAEMSTAPSCIVGPASPGIDTTVAIVEQVV